MDKGKIIVLEGLDGCGKSTQLSLLADRLSGNGVRTRLVSFPNYDSPGGRLVSGYLGGEIPCEGETGAYAASSFYAIDRYISYSADWRRDYDSGSVIVSGRYTTSNAIYQMTKLADNEREAYLNWLWDYEYNRLGLPRPDLVLFLDMPVEVSQRLLSSRYNGDEGKKDIHERDIEFMRKCRESAMFTSEKCGWSIIECSDGERPLPIEEIHNSITEKIKEIINV